MSTNNQQASDRAQKYLDIAAVMILALNNEGKVTLINQKGCEILGYSEEEILHQNWFQNYVPGRYQKELKEVFKRLLAGETQTSESFENHVITRSGEERIVSFRNAVLTDPDGQITGTLSSGEDVTERRYAERHATVQSEVARLLARAPSFDLVVPELLYRIGRAEQWNVGELWIQDPARGVIYRADFWAEPSMVEAPFVDTSRQIHFKAGEGLIGAAWNSGKPQAMADISRSRQFVRASLAGEADLHGAFAIPIHDGGKVQAVLGFYGREVRQIDDGLMLMLGSLAQQIDEFIEVRKAAEARRESEVRLRTILNTVADGIITIDEKGLVQTFNPAAEKIFGYKTEEVVGRNVSLLMPEPDKSRHNQYIANYLSTGKAKIIGIGREVTGRRKDGTTFPMYLSVGEMRLGGKIMFTGIVRDFTDFRVMQEELVNARNLAAIGEMAATVAHEIKNPLAGIAGALQVIRDEMSWQDPYKEIVEEVFSQVNRLDNTVRHLLMFARPWEVQKECSDVPTIAKELVESARKQPELKGISFDFTGDMQLKAVLDPGLLEHVLWNLIRNAAQAMPDGGEVQLRFSQNSGRVRIEIADCGEGISEANQERIFRPFFTTRAQGTGLGLAICKKIMDAHRGSIEIFSQVEKGTRVVLEFPRGSRG